MESMIDEKVVADIYNQLLELIIPDFSRATSCFPETLIQDRICYR